MRSKTFVLAILTTLVSVATLGTAVAQTTQISEKLS